MSISQQELAERWGISKGRVSQLVAAGMPLTSVEDAELWRNRRHEASGIAPRGHSIPQEGAEAALPPESDATGSPEGEGDPFAELVNRQTQLVRISRAQYLRAVQDGSPQQSRLYQTYDKNLKTLISLQREALSRQVTSRELIKMEFAVERFGKIIAEMRQDLEKVELELASKANPANPAKALSAWREVKNKMMEKWSHLEGEARG